MVRYFGKEVKIPRAWSGRQ